MACFRRSATLLRAQPGVCLRARARAAHAGRLFVCFCHSFTNVICLLTLNTCCVPGKIVCVCVCRGLFCSTNLRCFSSFFVFFSPLFSRRWKGFGGSRLMQEAGTTISCVAQGGGGGSGPARPSPPQPSDPKSSTAAAELGVTAETHTHTHSSISRATANQSNSAEF